MSGKMDTPLGKIITFYSYKGGTGRSMALANIAWVLASNGRRVLVVDWDLEAPGVHRYFYPFMLDRELTSSDGVINLVSDYVMAAMTPSETPPSQSSNNQPPPEKWYESYANILRYATSLDWDFEPNDGRKGYIDLIPAGRQGPSYATLMNSFNWQNFYDKFGGGGFMEAVKQKMKEEYDYVLIDSRTGVSDTSGVCTVQLPDILVVCFTLNRQSIDGATAVAESVSAQRRDSSGASTIRIFPVPTRVERAEKIKLDLAREEARDRFSSLLWHIKPEEQDLYWGRVEVNYEPFYAFEEILAAFGDKPRQTSSLLASMERLTTYLSDHEVTEIAPVSETERKKALSQYARQRRPVRRVRNDSAEAAQEFLFYLSYARTDWNDHLDKFVQDLLREVSSRTGRPVEQVGFVDINSISPGAEWDVELTNALQHSRVLVPLYSPAYFSSAYCGKEFQYILDRQKALAGQQPDQARRIPLLPVIWIPNRSSVPRAAADIQFTFESFPPEYNKNGLSYLMRLRKFEEIYQEFVLLFAQKLVEVAESSPLHVTTPLPPLNTIPNAFDEQIQGATPPPVLRSTWDEKEFEEKLRVKLENNDGQGVSELCDSLIVHLRQRPDAYPLPEARRILNRLRSKRYFGFMEEVANALIQSGQDALDVRRKYAQALADQDKMTAAITMLKSLIADTAAEPDENNELRGLLGLAYKQLYVDAADPSIPRNQQNLALAIHAYYDVYRLDPDKLLWHGVNAVALLRRAERDKVRLDEYPAPRDEAERLAAEILDQIEELYHNANAFAWDFATAAEACLALEKYDDAMRWLDKYVADPKVDAFSCASTLRQFEEVWLLDVNEEPGSHLLPLLSDALLKREGGRVNLSPGKVSAQFTASGEFKTDKTYEKVFGTDSFMGLEAYRHGLERCRAIALIGMPGEARGFGTGFLIRGGELHPSYGDELLLMTNAHVISDDPNSIRPGEVEVSFEALDRVKCGIEKVLWSSPPTQCDATLLRLSMSDDTATLLKQVAPYPVVKEPPALNDRARVCIIGHPGGAGLSLSLQDNLLLDYDDQKMHYRTPTENGSAGSPVFNKQWKLIGLHHKGDSRMPKLNGKPGTYEANEGIRISAIIEALAAKLGG